MSKLTDKLGLKKLWIFAFLLVFCSLAVLIDAPVIHTALLFGMCAIVSYKANIPKYPLFLGFVALFIRLIIVFVFRTPPESDFSVLFDASQSLLSGDRSYLDTVYFQRWSYQNGFVAFQSLLLMIWNSIYMLKLFNCLIASATVVLVYLIAKELASEKAARLVSLVYCFFPFSLFYVTVLTNQFMASFLIYLGLYIFISDSFKMKSCFKCLVLAVLLSLANTLRPESVIPLFSAALFLLLTVDRSNRKKQLRDLAILIAVYFTLNRLISGLFILTGLSPNGLTNNAPYWKFVLGLNHESSGVYTDSDVPYLRDAQAAWDVVRERALVPFPDLVKLFAEKVRIFWDGSGLQWSLRPFAENGVTVFGTAFRISDDYAVWQLVSKYTVLVLYALVILGVFRYAAAKNTAAKNAAAKKEPGNKFVLLFVNQVFVTYGVYLLIEVQSRYAYHVQISVAILAALGVKALYERFSRHKESTAE